MQFLLHNNTLLEPIETPLYKGWAPAKAAKVLQGQPRFIWKGAKIPFEMWEQVVAFLRWTQQKYKAEAMVLFFYNINTDQWAVWPFPQEPNGMTIRLLPNDPMYAADRTRFGDGWIQAGSVHHHCTAKAFQSGTDRTDEENRDGVHITLGEMDKPVLDLHIRQVFDGLMGDSDILDWVETPKYLEQVPEEFQDQFGSFVMRATRATEFPEEWKTRIVERPTHVYQQGFIPGVATPQGQPQGKKKRTLITDTTTDIQPPYKHVPEPIGPNENGTLQKVLAACTALSITPVEALRLLSLFFQECNDTEQAVRNALVDALRKSGVPVLYAESILERYQDAA